MTKRQQPRVTEQEVEGAGKQCETQHFHHQHRVKQEWCEDKHNRQREKNTIVAFPSLMFVRRVPYESVRRRKIRHWWLLALRLLALALIVAAFARPFVRGSAAAMSGGAREVVVLVDRSYSMGYGTRWARAHATELGIDSSGWRRPLPSMTLGWKPPLRGG